VNRWRRKVVSGGIHYSGVPRATDTWPFGQLASAAPPGMITGMSFGFLPEIRSTL
jgi:hypothetical protein